ncbi:hypothetical protein Tco_1322890, partial [Tanacetum coccineum]
HDYARMMATLNDVMSNQFKDAEENPNEPPRYLYNKDLFFLMYGNTKERSYILSLYKIHAVPFPEDDLEEKLKRWVMKEFKTFNEEARLSIHHWKDSWHKRMYMLNKRRVKENLEEYFSNHRITKAVRVPTDQQHGLDYMEQIIMMREKDKPDSYSEADFKYLNKNDIEDLYYLYPNKKVNFRSISTWEDLTTRFLFNSFHQGGLQNSEMTSLCSNNIKEGLSLKHGLISRRRTIDQLAGGKLHDRNSEESWALLEDLALYENEMVPTTVNTVWKIPSKLLLSMRPRVPTKREASGLVSNFMASQDARLSKFEANFKQQQSEVTNKIYTVLKAIIDRITGALPSDTVKNPKLNVNSTSPVLSACSFPIEDPQCSTRIHNSINAIKTFSKETKHSQEDQLQTVTEIRT